MPLISCPVCSRNVSSTAPACPACGHPVAAQTGAATAVANPMQSVNQVVNVNVGNHGAVYKRWSPGVAAILSLFISGLGQMYKGQIFNGIAWFFVVGVGYFFLIIQGLVLHLCCILGAAMGNPYR